MTPQDNKVLACVDLSPYAQHVADHAAWAAARMGAPLEFLHVIDRHPALQGSQDHSGAIGANAQEVLLKSLSEADAARTRAEREQARSFLQGLRERALAAGASPVDTRQRHGDLEETLSEQQAGVRLFVLGRRGASAAQTQQALGRHVEWTVRSLQRPILTVTDRFKAPERVLIAFDGTAITRQGVEMVAASPLFQGLPVHVLMSGKPSGDGPKQIEWARQTLAQAGFEVTAEIQPGDPQTAVAQAIEHQGIDLLIMGAYTHSPLRQLFRGSKTTELLRAARVPTLLLR
ncbi:MAG: universal stress protein [Betaproteobacteria bacterium HGW-Betaproteobacteria-9]|jgi:nucleotide-binding universal stress UspA family protein|nr:MAG: universal stress protein [Betaproteobacteria bacterium HGW-Betaproteobacteria-9]